MATIDNLSIQINANAEAAIAAINRTASSAERLRGAAQGAAGGMQSAAQGAQDMGSSTAQAGEQTEKTRKSLHGFWNALKQSGSYMGGAFLGGMKGIVGALGSMASGLLRIAKFRIYRTIVKDLGQSFKDLYGWSKMFGSEYANSMDRINSSFVYLRNSIASAAAPLFNALAPVLDAIIDKIVTLLNWLNQLFSALSGASTYTVAKKVEQSWVGASSNAASNAKKASDEIKRTILGFDEINKLSKESSSSGGSGSGGSSPYTSGYQYMFEEKELAGGWKDFATAIENAMSDAFSRITMIVGGAELALGAILALSGANVPLGLGLMATGAVTIGSAIFANWEGISNNVKLAVAGVEAAVAGGLAVGAVLAFSGGHVGLGIGLMIAALSTGMGAATIAWNTIGDKMSEKVQAIATLVGGASFGIGAVLAFAGHPGIGIAMMIAGASVTAVSINWNFLKEKLEGPIGAVTALISGASLALGILALLSGNIPIGLGLILAGTAGLATTVAANWDNLVNIGKTAIEKVKEGWETVKELVVNAVVSLVKKAGEWANDVWDFLQNTGATIAKKVTAAFEAATSFAGDVWETVKAGAETIGKTVTAMFSAIGQWTGNVWETVKAGAETIGKTVTALFSPIGAWTGNVWDFVKTGAETIVKTVEAGMEKADSWIDSIVDFILGPESTDKKANLIMAIENTALAIVNFLRDPATAIKNIALNIVDDVKEGAKGLVDAITSPTPLGIEANVNLNANSGDGIDVDKYGYASLAESVSGTTILSPISGNGLTVDENGAISLDKPMGARLQAQNTPTDAFGGGENNPLSFFGRLFRKDQKKDSANKVFNGGATLKYYGALFKKAKKYAPGIVFANNSLFKYFAELVKQNKGMDASIMFAAGAIFSYFADLVQNWKGTPQKALGLENLKAQIKVDLVKGSKDTVSFEIHGGGTGKGTVSMQTKKRGGIFSNGSWKDIPQYANGTTNAHGSMFIAGEAGPELVGHLGGRTEVLNQSQLAATMFSAVRAAMGGVKIAATMYSGSAGGDESDYETMYRAMYDAFTDAMSGSEQRDREKVALMREIAAKEFTAEVSAQSVNRANTRLNRRAGMTIVPVGT